MLFRWFVGLSMDDEVWSATTFSKNRERLLKGDVAGAFFKHVRKQAEEYGLLSDEHFTVDGTLLEVLQPVRRLRGIRPREAGSGSISGLPPPRPASSGSMLTVPGN